MLQPADPAVAGVLAWPFGIPGVDACHLGCRPGLWKLGGVDIGIKVVPLQK